MALPSILSELRAARSLTELTSLFRRRAREVHPDKDQKNHAATANFQLFHACYEECLSRLRREPAERTPPPTEAMRAAWRRAAAREREARRKEAEKEAKARHRAFEQKTRKAKQKARKSR